MGPFRLARFARSAKPRWNPCGHIVPFSGAPPCGMRAPNVCNCTWHLSSGADLASLTLDEVWGTCRGRIAIER